MEIFSPGIREGYLLRTHSLRPYPRERKGKKLKKIREFDGKTLFPGVQRNPLVFPIYS